MKGSRLCNQHLTKRLEKIRYQKSRVDNCMFYWRKVIFIVYVDYGIFASPSDAETEQVIV